MKSNKRAVILALLAATLYALSSPVSKLLLEKISATMLAALLYIGAGIGLTILEIIQRKTKKVQKEEALSKKDLPYILGMVILDIAAPILLMLSLTMTTAANVSLLNNFEIVATSMIALVIFKEKVSKKLWIAIGLVTLSSIMLSIEDMSSFSFSFGSVLVLLACICWGFENNCTRMLSPKNPIHIVIIKGFGSGFGSLLIAWMLGEVTFHLVYILIAFLLGFVAYGLSILLYIYAQRELGAAKTSTYYAVAPFIGVALSLIIFREMPTLSFLIAFIIMIVGTYLAVTDKK